MVWLPTRAATSPSLAAAAGRHTRTAPLTSTSSAATSAFRRRFLVTAVPPRDGGWLSGAHPVYHRRDLGDRGGWIDADRASRRGRFGPPARPTRSLLAS